MAKKIFLILIMLFAISFPVLADGEGATCPAGQVKLEVDDNEYEYTDGSAWITADSSTARWGPNEGFTVNKVCIKIGGPHGGSLIWPDAGSGEWTSTTYGISHVVLYTESKPTAVKLTSFTAVQQQGVLDASAASSPLAQTFSPRRRN
jgi:hypothetical protein